MDVEHLEPAVGADVIESVFSLRDDSHIVVYQRVFVSFVMSVPCRAPQRVDAAQAGLPRCDPKVPLGIGVQRIDGSDLFPLYDASVCDAEQSQFRRTQNQPVARNDEVVDAPRMLAEVGERKQRFGLRLLAGGKRAVDAQDAFVVDEVDFAADAGHGADIAVVEQVEALEPQVVTLDALQ